MTNSIAFSFPSAILNPEQDKTKMDRDEFIEKLEKSGLHSTIDFLRHQNPTPQSIESARTAFDMAEDLIREC